MKYFYLLFVCCLAGIHQTSAACANPSAVATYNETAMLGTWYVVGSNVQSTYTCIKYTFTAGSGVVNYQYQNATGKSSTTTPGTWTPVSGSSGKYNDAFPASSTSTVVVTVAATDYSSYAVLNRCYTVATFTIDVYELLSRSPNGFTAAKTSAGSAIPTAVTMFPLNNNCPTGTIKDLFLVGRR